MSTKSEKQIHDWREGRRLRGWELLEKGWKQKDVAEALGVSKGAVSQWASRGRKEGVDSLRYKKPSGAPSRLSPEQRARLPELLAHGAESYGFKGDIWTQPRVAQVIEREFGITYDPSQVGRILKRCALSLQKPQKRASQRDELSIQAWEDERWPTLKKSPTRTTHYSVRG